MVQTHQTVRAATGAWMSNRRAHMLWDFLRYMRQVQSFCAVHMCRTVYDSVWTRTGGHDRATPQATPERGASS